MGGDTKKKQQKVKDNATGVEVAVPAPPRRLSAYQTFVQQKREATKAAHPAASSQEVLAKLATAWNATGSEERATLEKEADADLSQRRSMWAVGEDIREAERRRVCRALDLSVDTKWASLYETVMTRNATLGGPSVSPRKKSSYTPPPKADALTIKKSQQWATAFQGQTRRRAVMSGLDAIFSLSSDPQNFDQFGNDAIQCFYDVARVTEDPVRANALMFVEQLARRWRHRVLARGWRSSGRPTPQQVLEAIVGLYCLERVGVSAPKLKEDVLHAVRLTGPDADDALKPYSAKDYFGWDPINDTHVPEGVAEVLSGESVTVYRTLCNSLIHAFYAERAMIDVGCKYSDVLRKVATLRPYKSAGELSWESYVDQAYLITHVVFTLNNWGELALEPELLPHEHLFIRENIGVAVRERDAHLVGEYVECLRAFGATDSDPLVQLGMAFLLRAQDPATHRWDTAGDAYTSYHATMVACQALLVHTHRGYGPGLPSCVAVLEEWHAAERPGDVREDPDVELRKRVDAIRKAPPAPAKPAPTPAEPKPASPEKKKRPASPDKTAKPPPKKKKKAVPTLSKEDVADAEAKLREAVESQAWPAAAKLLKRLADHGVSVELLKTTTVGKTVATLKKAADAKVAMAAKGLVARWKQMVRDADAA